MAASTMASFMGSTQCFQAKNVSSTRGQVDFTVTETRCNVAEALLMDLPLAVLRPLFGVVACSHHQPV